MFLKTISSIIEKNCAAEELKTANSKITNENQMIVLIPRS